MKRPRCTATACGLSSGSMTAERWTKMFSRRHLRQTRRRRLRNLREILKYDQPVRIIEGIDIANIGGEEAVGSLVKFIDGRPFKSGYRRFKIKTVTGIDDYAMIREVVTRRYKYAKEGEELWPDLVLIDGGLGHLHAAQEAFAAMEAAPPRLASIAKKHEEIYLPESSTPLRLAPRSPARKLTAICSR